MKITILGDLHWRVSKPNRRKDDYFSTLQNKLKYVVDYSNRNNVAAIILPGDVFDSSSVNDYGKNCLINIVNKSESPILCVAGQHDQNMRDLSLDRTSLGVLISSGVIHHLTNESYSLGEWNIYGCDYNVDPPSKIDTKNNILVIHRMISDKDYWYGHVNYDSAGRFLKANKSFDIIASGDNHRTFISNYKDRYLFNAGSVGRQNLDQVEHKPCFFIVDLKSKTYEQIFIPVLPIEDIMDTFIETISNSSKVDEYIEKLSSEDGYVDVDFIKQMSKLIENVDDEDIKQIIYEALGYER